MKNQSINPSINQSINLCFLARLAGEALEEGVEGVADGAAKWSYGIN